MRIVASALIGLLLGGCYSATIIDSRRPELASVHTASGLDGDYLSAGLLYRHIHSAPVVTNMTSAFPRWNEYGSPKEGAFRLEVSESEVRIDHVDGTRAVFPRASESGDTSLSPVLDVGRIGVDGEGVSGHGQGTAKLLKGVDGSLIIEYDIRFSLRSLLMPYTERETFWAVYKKKPNQALEPTPLSVTPAASAPVAPARGVAHL